MRTLAILSLTLVLAPGSVAAETFRQWATVCHDGCRTYTSTNVKLYRDTKEPNLILLEIDENNDVVVSSLISWEKFQRFYTLNPPTELRRAGRRYVADRGFFQTEQKATLRVDGDTIMKLSPVDDAHLVASATTELVDSFQGGRKATVTGKGFCAAVGCKSQTLTFSLMGFTKAYATRTDKRAEQRNSALASPLDVVAASLPGNKYGIERGFLHTMDNPHGAGAFVYVPKVEVTGYDRYFIWFVNGEQAVALNGPTITATPEVPRPLEVGYKFWKGTGLSDKNVTDRALEIVYGQ